MIESIYNGESKEKRGTSSVMFRMPKNIRQIGQGELSPKIYMEDYVMTFIRQLAMRDYGNYKIAVLLGQFVKNDGEKNIFINGAVEAYEIDVENENAFSNETWTNIYDSVKKYFQDVEIVGWYIAKPGLMLETTEMITKIHVNNFAGQDKTLLMYDSIEKEEVFYIYDKGKLNKQQGYYIYYDKNEEMQSYMVDNKKIPSEEGNFDDRAIKEIRQIIELKKDNRPVKEKGSTVNLLYVASTMLAVVVLVIGATMLNNYDKMNSMESTLNVISDHIVEDASASKVENEVDVTTVKRMTGDIDKIKEGTDEAPGTTDEIPDEKIIKEPVKDIPEEASEGKKYEEVPEGQSETTNEVTKKVRYYTIKEGDTLAAISTKYYQSIYYVDEILKANKIDNKNKIMVGQKIVIP